MHCFLDCENCEKILETQEIEDFESFEDDFCSFCDLNCDLNCEDCDTQETEGGFNFLTREMLKPKRDYIKKRWFKTKIADEVVKVDVYFKENFSSFAMFKFKEREYNKELKFKSWNKKELKKLSKLFFSYKKRNRKDFGTKHFESLTNTQIQNIVIQMYKDIFHVFNKIIQLECSDFDARLYSSWYREEIEDLTRKEYNKFITVNCCHLIVHNNFSTKKQIMYNIVDLKSK